MSINANVPQIHEVREIEAIQFQAQTTLNKELHNIFSDTARILGI